MPFSQLPFSSTKLIPVVNIFITIHLPGFPFTVISLISVTGTFIVFIFDSIFAWFIQVPISLLLAYKTNLSLPILFLVVNLLEIIKLILGSILLRTNVWLKNLTIEKRKINV